MTMTAVYIDIWQQCTLNGAGLKSLWVVDILGTELPKCNLTVKIELYF